MSVKGSIISFEGITCSGKSTLVDNFRVYLGERKIKCFIKEDLKAYTGKDLGAEIKDILEKYRHDDYYRFGMPQLETLLILAKRAFQSHSTLINEINRGVIILADRDIDTVCASQLVELVDKIPSLDINKTIEVIRYINNLSIMSPKLTFYLDVDICVSEIRSRRRDNKIFNKNDIDYNTKVKEYFNKVFDIAIPNRDLLVIPSNEFNSDEIFKRAKTRFEEWYQNHP